MVDKALRWNLVSAGLSRRHLKKKHLLRDAPLVTVNRAIDITSQGFRVDFAAFLDSPDATWVPLDLGQHLRPYTQMWIPMDEDRVLKKKGGGFTVFRGSILAQLWDKVLPAGTGMRPLPYPSLVDENREEGQDGRVRFAFCLFAAYARISMFRPKLIRILCADMKGPWIENKTEEECETYSKENQDGLLRWKYERDTMDSAAKILEENCGTKTEFVIPEGAEALSVS